MELEAKGRHRKPRSDSLTSRIYIDLAIYMCVCVMIVKRAADLDHRFYFFHAVPEIKEEDPKMRRKKKRGVCQRCSFWREVGGVSRLRVAWRGDISPA